MQINQIWEVIFVKGWKKHYITSKPFYLAVRENTIYTGNFFVPFLKESIYSFF
jgi:hypothetical protein